MKISKVLLGISASALGVICAITTASAHRVTPVYYSTGTACLGIVLQYDCRNETIISCTALIFGVHRQLFATVDPLNIRKCIKPLTKSL